LNSSLWAVDALSNQFLVSLADNMRMTAPPSLDDRWRQTHKGRLLGHAMRRFEAR
jgi:hypothetical protein